MIAATANTKSFSFMDGIANRGLRHSHYRGNFSLGFSRFPHESNRVLLVLGQGFLNLCAFTANMLPDSKRLNLVNMTLIKFKLLCNGLVGKSCVTQSPDFQHLLIGQLVKRRKFSVWDMVSSFFSRVFHVVLLCTKPDVAGIHTTRVVALVKAEKSIFNCSIGNRPSHAVSPNRPSVDTELAVPVIVARALPNPTFIKFSFINLFPKPVQNLLSEFWIYSWNIYELMHVVIVSKSRKVSI